MKPYKTRQKGAVSVLLIILMLLSASTAGIIYAISKRKPLPTLPSPIAEHRQAMPTATPDLTKTTTDPNWDVYVSESCGIEFRYPKGYLASMDDDYCHFFIAAKPEQPISDSSVIYPENRSAFFIQIDLTSSSISPVQLGKDSEKTGSGIIAGYPAWRTEGEFTSGRPYQKVTIKRASDFILFNLYWDEHPNLLKEPALAVLEDMLSTLKISEPTKPTVNWIVDSFFPADKTENCAGKTQDGLRSDIKAGWCEYKNDLLGFSFQYPPGFQVGSEWGQDHNNPHRKLFQLGLRGTENNQKGSLIRLFGLTVYLTDRVPSPTPGAKIKHIGNNDFIASEGCETGGYVYACITTWNQLDYMRNRMQMSISYGTRSGSYPDEESFSNALAASLKVLETLSFWKPALLAGSNCGWQTYAIPDLKIDLPFPALSEAHVQETVAGNGRVIEIYSSSNQPDLIYTIYERVETSSLQNWFLQYVDTNKEILDKSFVFEKGSIGQLIRYQGPAQTLYLDNSRIAILRTSIYLMPDSRAFVAGFLTVPGSSLYQCGYVTEQDEQRLANDIIDRIRLHADE